MACSHTPRQSQPTPETRDVYQEEDAQVETSGAFGSVECVTRSKAAAGGQMLDDQSFFALTLPRVRDPKEQSG